MGQSAWAPYVGPSCGTPSFSCRGKLISATDGRRSLRPPPSQGPGRRDGPRPGERCTGCATHLRREQPLRTVDDGREFRVEHRPWFRTLDSLARREQVAIDVERPAIFGQRLGPAGQGSSGASSRATRARQRTNFLRCCANSTPWAWPKSGSSRCPPVLLGTGCATGSRGRRPEAGRYPSAWVVVSGPFLSSRHCGQFLRRLHRDLVGAQTRRMIKDLAGDHQLVGAGALHKSAHLLTHRLG